LRVYQYLMDEWKIKPVTEFIGRSGENRVTRIQIKTVIEENCAYTMNVMVGNKITSPIVLALNGNILYHDIEAAELTDSELKFQITGTFSDGRKIKSNIIKCRVERSLSGDELVTPTEVTAFEEALQAYAESLSTVHNAVEEVEAIKSEIEEDNTEAIAELNNIKENAETAASQSASMAVSAASSATIATAKAESARVGAEDAALAKIRAEAAASNAQTSAAAALQNQNRAKEYADEASSYANSASAYSSLAQIAATNAESGKVAYINESIINHNANASSHQDIRDLISSIPRTTRYIVSYLPSAGIDENGLYLVKSGDAQLNDTYEEYIRVKGKWESLGLRKINLDGLARITELNAVRDEVTAVKILKMTELPEASLDNHGRFCIISDGSDDKLYINLKTEGLYKWHEFKKVTSALGSGILGALFLGEE